MLVLSGLFTLALLTSCALFVFGIEQRAKPTSTTKLQPVQIADKPSAAPNTIQNNPSAQTNVAKSALYIIEEEKLAHDVYEYLYSKWGSRVFTNISRSETLHQSEVLTILNTRSIQDPRLSELGKFNNPELQALYDSLIAQGSKSITDAYKVGIAIEERDIADVQKAINATDAADKDIIAVYESLIAGSKNHLAAFNRQYSR